ncbi:MAG TPA: hypothetical protein PLE73_02590 [Spirochaetota bacterium]|nr:hypothetical protein [Spirochaetota bacterium]HPI22055.1 hypothetical protein [Spirochaetota bacterium]HPU88170.1 hypothetical protein [Spirochaetota bacterium]
MIQLYLAIFFVLILALGALARRSGSSRARAIVGPLAGCAVFLMCLVGFEQYSGVFPILVSAGILLLAIADVYLSIDEADLGRAGRFFALFGSMALLAAFAPHVPFGWWCAPAGAALVALGVWRYRAGAGGVAARARSAAAVMAMSLCALVVAGTAAYYFSWGGESAFLASLVAYFLTVAFRAAGGVIGAK